MQKEYTVDITPKKHRHQVIRQMLITSSDTEIEAKPIRLSSSISWILLILVSLALGALIGFYIYQGRALLDYQAEISRQETVIESLEAENAELQLTVSTLNDRVQILSDTVNTKVAAEQELTEALESQILPTGFPLSGSASVAEAMDGAVEATEDTPAVEGNPILIFTASEGGTVIAAGGGTVTKVEEDAEYGYAVTIDHGNGYVTIYRNKGEAMVKEGESVSVGNTLFLITSDNTKLGYQMLLDGEYINPMDMISIDG